MRLRQLLQQWEVARRVSVASSLPSDLARSIDPLRAPAPIDGSGTARKLDLVCGTVALDKDEARLTELRRADDDDVI